MRYHLESTLPIHAFNPLGGRHSPFKHGMTLEGGGGGIIESVGNVIGGTIEAVGQGIVDAGSSVNEFVKEEVPGGWATVAAVAVPYAAPMVTGAALTAGQAAALAAATSATAGVIEGRDPEDILKSAALAAAGSYGTNALFSGGDGVPNWDADITAGADGYAGAAGSGAGAGLSADMNLDAPYVDMPDGEYLLNTPTDQGGLPSLDADMDLDAPYVDTPDGEYLLNTPTDQGGLPDWDADITAGAEGYAEAGGLPDWDADITAGAEGYAGASGIPDWDADITAGAEGYAAASPLIPREVREALDAANKARQLYNMSNSLMRGGTRMISMPTLGQYITPTTSSDQGGLANIGIPNLTAGIVRGQPIDLNIDQFNSPLSPVRAAEGGYIQHYAEAGQVDSYTDTNYQDTVTGLAKLKPNLIRGKSDFGLQKYWNAPAGHADGGSIEGHNPEFFSEGGLQNRYVKGEGDGTSDDVPAMLANGEFVIPADVVSSLGNGSNDSGAHLLDEFLQVIREHKRKADAKDLPPDSKGALGYLLEAKRKAR